MRIGVAGPEHAGEALTVQRAAYVTEAQRYSAPGIPPLVETLEQLRADLAASAAAPPAVRRFRLVTGALSADNPRLCAAAGHRPTGGVRDAAGVGPVRLERAAVDVGGRS